MTPILGPRRDYLIADDGAETRAYRVPTTDDNLDGHDRRTLDRRERISRTFDRMQATSAEISLLAAADRRNHDRRIFDRMQATSAEVSRIAAEDRAKRAARCVGRFPACRRAGS